MINAHRSAEDGVVDRREEASRAMRGLIVALPLSGLLWLMLALGVRLVLGWWLGL
jgi:hypothetical protein